MGDVLRFAAVHDPPSHSVPGASVDRSVLLDGPLPSELIEDSEVEPRASQSRLIKLSPSHPAMLWHSSRVPDPTLSAVCPG